MAPRTFQTVFRNVRCALLVLAWKSPPINVVCVFPHRKSVNIYLQYFLSQIRRPGGDQRNVRLNPSAARTDHKLDIAKLFLAQEPTEVVVQRATRVCGKLYGKHMCLVCLKIGN